MRKPPAFYTASLAMGDCICATPTIRKISSVYNEKVKVFSHFPEVFARLPYVSSSEDIKDYQNEKHESLRRDYDVHYSFFRIGQRVQISDDRGIELKHAIMDIRQYHAIDNGFMLKNEELHCDFIPADGSDNLELPIKYVCLHPFKNWPSRTWSDDNWNQLIRGLIERKIPVVIIGRDKLDDKLQKFLRDSGFDHRVMEEAESRKVSSTTEFKVLDLTNETTISQAWHVLNRAACVVTMDSGILHLAGTTDAHIIQLGSSIDPAFRAPYRKGSQSYKYTYVPGSCNIFCASNMKYSLRDWENGYGGGTPLQSVPLIDTCLEHKPTMECHPQAEAVLEQIENRWSSLNAFSSPLSYEEIKEALRDGMISAERKISENYSNVEIIKIQSSSLGDTIGALPVIQAYSQGKKIAVISGLGKEFFEKSYPNMEFHPHESEPELDPQSGNYKLGEGIYKDFKRIHYKFDRPLMKGYADQLNVDTWSRPKLDLHLGDRPIKSKYICFSMHSTAQCKHWNYPNGWDTLCRMLRKAGLTPVCIDRHSSFGIEGWWNPVPAAAVKKQGMNLQEMTNYIHHSEFFVGISSGLSWVAHALKKPVVMISGVTSEDNEFEEDTLRIINKSVCHGCFNDTKKYKFDAGNWLWCPAHSGTARQFECTTTITPEQIYEKIREWKPELF